LKIALVTPSPKPFLIGGAEKLFIGMLYYINKYSRFNLELIKLPCHDTEFWSLINCYKQFFYFDLMHFDMVITTKYPAWAINHPNHVLYLQHPCRGVYDLYKLTQESLDWISLVNKFNKLKELKKILLSVPSRKLLPYLFEELTVLEKYKNDFPEIIWKFPGPLTRAIIHFLDKATLAPKNIYNPYGINKYNAISKTVALRENYLPPNVEVKVIYHPSSLNDFSSKSYDFIFTASRLENLKRIDLLIKAFKKVKKNINFYIAGTGGQEKYLKSLAKGDKRIKFLGYLSDEELLDYYSNALFVPFIPYNEDYGLITIEAMKSKKAVLTATDSGGVRELVQHKFNGLVVEPNVNNIAQAIDYLVSNKKETIQMGNNAYQTVKDINWKNFVLNLFGENSLRDKFKEENKKSIIIKTKQKEKPSLLVLSTFNAYPAISGGKLRLFNLYKGLSRYFDITILSLSDKDNKVVINENFREIQVKRSKEFIKISKKISNITGVSSDDVASIEGYKLIPEFIKTFNEIYPKKDGIILFHPYLINMLDNIHKPIFLDSPDVEINQKKGIFDNEFYLSMVMQTESKAITRSTVIYPTSEEDKSYIKDFYKVTEDKIIIIPNGININKIKPLNKFEKKALKFRLGINDKLVAIFVGSLHKPNEEALKTVVKLAEKFKDVIFPVVGSICNVLKNYPSNLIPLGVITEEEKDIILKASDIGLNPILYGSGSNLKILEYLAYKLIVISTPFGARGFNIKDEVLLTDIENFEDTFKFIMDNIDNFDIMLNKAYKLAKNFDWSIISAKLKEELIKYV